MKGSRREIGRAGRARAMELHEALHIENVDEIDAEAIAAHFGVFVEHGGLRGADGRLARRGNGGTIRIRSEIAQRERIRYIIAHELGHFFLHGRDEPTPLCSELEFYAFHTSTRESEANWFAAELLMPRKLFEPRCDVARPSFAHVEAVRKDFKTPLTSTAIRFVDLAPEPCALVWSEAGKIKWAIKGPTFFENIEFGRTLDKFSHARDAFNGKRLPDGPQIVPARAWVTEAHGDVHEDSIWFSKLRVVLTLLWWPSD